MGIPKHARLCCLPVVLLFASVAGQPVLVPFRDCTSDDSFADAARRINVTSVYAQIADYGDHPMLKMTVVGDLGQNFIGATPDHLSTLFVNTDILSFNIDQTASAFCASLRAPLSVQQPNYIDNNCSIPAGQVAFSASTPYRHDFSLTTINTRLRAVDGSSLPLELVCLDLDITPVEPKGTGGYYGKGQAVFWVTVSLAIAYWLVVGMARIAAAWGRASWGRRSGWVSVQWAGTILASAVSGERLAASPSLLRFATPSMRDIIFHTQWCAGMGMLAVQWPHFIYPILRNTAWATLAYNITLIQGVNSTHEHWDSVNGRQYDPPASFAQQMADRTTPLYLDSDVPNSILVFPDGTKEGMASWAYAIGLRPQDLFGICMGLFLIIAACIIGLSLLIWAVDWMVSSATMRGSGDRVRKPHNARSPRYSDGSDLPKDELGSPRAGNVSFPGQFPPTSRGMARSRKAWWHYRLGQNSFHGSVLYGNLVRLLLLFHFPITCYTCYQFSLGKPLATTTSLVLAGLTFAVCSLILPALLLSRLFVTPTGKLYEATRTLLALGPLYNHYTPDWQKFACVVFLHHLSMGVVIGAGQNNGTVQAIALLIIEVFAALATSMWLPWREGAHMGAISFMFCVARIITCVLLVILSPIVDVGHQAGGWVAYAILIINGLIYLTFFLMLIFKIIEGLIRLFAGISFDRSRQDSDSGLFGAIGMTECCGGRKRQRARRHRYRPNHATRPEEVDGLNSNSTQNMLAHAAYFSPYAPSPGQHPGHPSPSPQPPPSFLRPEQALTPYREDGDDPETGFILGAFHEEYQHPEHPPQFNQPSSSSTSSTGFARIKGGRAHFESPFAIQASQERSPAPGRAHNNPAPSNRPAAAPWDSPPASYPPSSFVAHAPAPNQPFGAHARKKSETAMVEDSGLLTPRATVLAQYAAPMSRSVSRPEPPLPPPVIPSWAEDDSGESSAAPRKKFWMSGSANKRSNTQTQDDSETDGEPSSPKHTTSQGVFSRLGIRRNRNKSEGDALGAASANPGASGGTGSSFVVVRGPPRASPLRTTAPYDETNAPWNQPDYPPQPQPQPPSYPADRKSAPSYP